MITKSSSVFLITVVFFFTFCSFHLPNIYISVMPPLIHLHMFPMSWPPFFSSFPFSTVLSFLAPPYLLALVLTIMPKPLLSRSSIVGGACETIGKATGALVADKGDGNTDAARLEFVTVEVGLAEELVRDMASTVGVGVINGRGTTHALGVAKEPLGRPVENTGIPAGAGTGDKAGDAQMQLPMVSQWQGETRELGAGEVVGVASYRVNSISKLAISQE